MADPKPLTTKEFSEFLSSPRAIRAFEKLFRPEKIGVFFDTTDQTSSQIFEPTVVTFNNSQTSRGVAIDPNNPSRIVVAEAGLYSFNYTLQLKEA